jgi:hypothetical protein
LEVIRIEVLREGEGKLQHAGEVELGGQVGNSVQVKKGASEGGNIKQSLEEMEEKEKEMDIDGALQVESVSEQQLFPHTEHVLLPSNAQELVRKGANNFKHIEHEEHKRKPGTYRRIPRTSKEGTGPEQEKLIRKMSIDIDETEEGEEQKRVKMDLMGYDGLEGDGTTSTARLGGQSRQNK